MFFNKIDLISPPITLYRKGELSHSSIFSGILTLLSYLTLFIIGVYLFSDIIERKNPTAYFFNQYIEDAGFFPINSSSIFNYIQIINSENSNPDPIDFDSIRIIGSRQIIETYFKGQNISEFDHWVYGYCNNDTDIRGIENVISSSSFTNSACIRKYFNKNEHKYYNTDEKGFIWPSVDKGCSNPKRTFYGIVIEQCKNDSLKNDCKPKNYINNYISKHSVNFQFIDHYANIYNYKSPIVKYFYNVTNALYFGSFTSNNLNFNPVSLKTHKGIFFDETIEELSYSFEQNEKVTYDLGENKYGLYAAFYFWMQNRMKYYERSYKKLVDVLANVGGVNNCILFIAGIINKLINKYITILDTQDLIIDLDRKIQNKINYQNSIDTIQVQLNSNNKKIYNRSDVRNPSKFKNNENSNIKNILNTDDKSVKYSYSIGAKNAMTNYQLLPNNNEFLNVVNKKKRFNTQYIFPINEKNKEYKLIKKVSFNFFEYIGYKISNNKRNKILIYESFRKKIISEEQLIQNYIDIYKLLSVCVNNRDETKKRGNFSMSLIINSTILPNL